MTEAKSIVSGGVAAGGTWALHVPPPGQLVFCAIVKGSCWLRLDGQRKTVQLHQGDVGLLTGGKGFLLCSHLSARPEEAPLGDEWGSMTTIGDGSGCTWLAGRVSLNPSSAFLLTEALPAMLLVRADSPGAASLQRLIEELITEQTSMLPGASIAAAQLAQLFFVRILRTQMGSASIPSGWLRATSDERLMRALRLMHAHPERSLGLAQLSKAAGMSRTRFAVHFKSLAGVAPLTYLTQWRMTLAQRALRDGNVAIFELAASLGYTSESAFSHAFKRVTGAAPRAWRASERRAEVGLGTGLERLR